MGDIVEFKEVVTFTVVGFTCDRCKATYRNDDVFEMSERITIEVNGGFGSVFGDGAELKCTLCQNCVKACLGEFLSEPIL